MIKFVFLDLDDTVFDFAAAEHAAISATLSEMDVVPSEDTVALYSRINLEHWKMLERGEMTRREMLTGRFDALFRELGVSRSSAATQAVYERRLSLEHPLLDGATKTLTELSARYSLYAVSNGTAHIQDRRIADSGIGVFFKDIFISQRVGADKPSRAFFDYCFSRIDGFEREKSIIVGDSPTSDILGGKNAGIATCLFDPHGRGDRTIVPDYTVRSLCELPNLLKTI